MAGRTAKTVKAAKPRTLSSVRTRAKASAKPKPTAKAPTKKAPTKKASVKKVTVKKALTKRSPAGTKAAVKSKAPAKKTPVKQTPTKKTPARKPAAKSAAKPGVRVKAVDKVMAAARTVKKVAAAPASPADAKILAELADLAKYIRAAKREIATIRPDNVKDEYLPKAADELDAVVEATAEATNTIMDACEVIEGVMADVSTEASAKLMDATTRIYEACTFQDITGQRIGKVVTTMKRIEESIDALIGAFGPKGRGTKKKTAQPKPKSAGSKQGGRENVTDADLLEGPQLGENAKSQAEIDDLFSSFD